MDRNPIVRRKWRSRMARLAAIGGGLAMAGCAGDLELQRLAARSVDGPPFQQALFAEYVELALTEAAEEDRRDAGIFMDQAMRVADGETVDPLPVSSRELTPDDAATLEAARLRLVTTLRRGGRIFAPVTAARAQGFFECWLQEQEEGVETVLIEVCRRRFELALADTLTALDGDIFTLLSDEGAPSGDDGGAAEPRALVPAVDHQRVQRHRVGARPVRRGRRPLQGQEADQKSQRFASACAEASCG